MADTPQSQNPGILANILAVAGFIILIIVIVWGAYHLLRLTGSGVTSLFSRFGGSDAITITVPRETESGTAFPISWNHDADEAGSYVFLYQCKSGFRFDVTTRGRANPVQCGTAFNVGTSTSLSLTPMLTGTTTADVPVSIVFAPTATSTDARPQGTATVRVLAQSGTTGTTVTPVAPSTNTPATTPAPISTGKPDLSVRILAVGTINSVTGAFENRYPVGPNDIAAVQFDIANNGGSASGNYYFTVNLPMQGGYLYTSPIQSSLTPGSHVVSTLRFKPVQSGGGTVTVNVDTTYAVGETNEGNNSAAMYISSGAWSGNYAPYVY